MKSLYIITGGILAVIAVVLIAPQKQHSTEEKASTPLDETESTILKEYGIDLSTLVPEDREMLRQQLVERLARDKAEIKKYGRVLTDEDRFQLEWQAEVKARQEAEFTELYARQKDWIDNFPFMPGYHPDILYDPENIAHSDEKFHAYRKELERKGGELWHERGEKSREIWARTDLSLEEKHAADDKLYREMEAAREPDPEIMAERRIIMRHKRLAGFYKQHYRYLPEFEQAYRIFEEEGAGDNPLRIANTMIPLESYFVTKRQANQHGLDELHPVQTRWDPKTKQNRRITWEEELKTAYGCITGNMMSQRNLIPGEENISREQAERIRDRLVAEILPDGFTGNTFLVGLADPKDEDMIPGQSLLAE